MAETFTVHLPTRREGPYTADELREMLASGRVRSTDAVMVTGGRMSTVAQVLPEALELSRVRPPTTERIVRKNSDRHAAVERRSSERLAAVGQPAPARTGGSDRLATPARTGASDRLTTPARTGGSDRLATPARTGGSDRHPSAARTGGSDRHPSAARTGGSDRHATPAAAPRLSPGLVKGIAIVAVLALLTSVAFSAWMWMDESASEPALDPGDLAGSWRAIGPMAPPALADLELRIDGTRFTVIGRAPEAKPVEGETPAPASSGDAKAERATICAISRLDERTLTIRLTPPDPQLGGELKAHRAGGAVALTTDAGSLLLQRKGK